MIMNISKDWKSIKRIYHILLIIFSMAFMLTGCQVLKETFGKEYCMIDDAFEQLEADVVFTLEEYAAKEGFTDEEWAEKQIYLDQTITGLHAMKAEVKNWLREGEELQGALGTNISVEDYVETVLVEIRVELSEEMKEASNGTLILQSTEVDRGFLGSIWHFIRNHWLISLMILGVINSIYEFITDKLYEREKKKEGE